MAEPSWLLVPFASVERDATKTKTPNLKFGVFVVSLIRIRLWKTAPVAFLCRAVLLFDLVSLYVGYFAITHNDQLTILFLYLLLQALLGQKDAGIYLFLHLFNFEFTHRLYSLHI